MLAWEIIHLVTGEPHRTAVEAQQSIGTSTIRVQRVARLLLALNTVMPCSTCAPSPGTRLIEHHHCFVFQSRSLGPRNILLPKGFLGYKVKT